MFTGSPQWLCLLQGLSSVTMIVPSKARHGSLLCFAWCLWYILPILLLLRLGSSTIIFWHVGPSGLCVPLIAVLCGVLGDGANKLFIRACYSAWVWVTCSKRRRACCHGYPADLDVEAKQNKKTICTFQVPEVNSIFIGQLCPHYFRRWGRWIEGNYVETELLSIGHLNDWISVFIELQGLVSMHVIWVGVVQWVRELYRFELLMSHVSASTAAMVVCVSRRQVFKGIFFLLNIPLFSSTKCWILKLTQK